MAISLGLHLAVAIGAAGVVPRTTVERPASPTGDVTHLTFSPDVPEAAVDVLSEPAVPAPRPQLAPIRTETPALEPPPPLVVALLDGSTVAQALLPLPQPVAASLDAAANTRVSEVVGTFDARPERTVRQGAEPLARLVALAGFGSAEPIRVARDDRAGGVRSAGFDVPASTKVPAVAQQKRIDTPVEIIFKPAPEYTDEAKALKIEGQVTLDVEFSASGEVRVLGVLVGLGHGLDEAAASATERVRFRPARAGGSPIDFRATVHVQFRLS